MGSGRYRLFTPPPPVRHRLRLASGSVGWSQIVYKRWIRCEPYRIAGDGWVPVGQVWEETPQGAVQRSTLAGDPRRAVATEQEAQVCSAALARRWLRDQAGRAYAAPRSGSA